MTDAGAARSGEPSLLPPIPPIAEAPPCGPDLEALGDAAYMNCIARLEGDLPVSYLSYLYPASEEDRVTIDFPRTFAELSGFMAGTHDLRLVVLQARFAILAGDLPRFARSVGQAASLLAGFWDTLHPAGGEEATEARRVALGALDAPAVTFALQYAPLCENRRTGRVSWRASLYAQNKAKPRPGEAAPSETVLLDAMRNAEPDEIGPAREAIALLVEALTQIRILWQARVGEAPPLDKLFELAGLIRDFMARALPEEPPSLMDRAASALGVLIGGKPAPAPAAGGITGTAEVGGALEALSRYFARAEPSSPARPLIDQAAQLRGKSFYEALQALLPKAAEQAAFKIGSGAVFELALSRAAAAGKDEAAAPDMGAAASTRVWQVDSRAAALAVMGEVVAYYKVAEPASPIPWLLDRASGLAERDFMSLLSDVLPKAALKDVKDA